jgi:protein-S-isoprenylcysteine O-methyltransferase Ste14
MTQMKFLKSTQRYRILMSRIFAILIILLLIFTSCSFPSDGLPALACNVTGLLMVVLCAYGRLWASFYICGNKSKNLITEGPYSMVRNPLYFFSLVGACGLGIASKNVVGLVMILALFVLYYPFVVIAEEKNLLERHKDAFKDYMLSTPRFFPRISQLKEPQSFEVNVHSYRKAYLDSMWFIIFYAGLQVIDWAHKAGIIPVLHRFP